MTKPLCISVREGSHEQLTDLGHELKMSRSKMIRDAIRIVYGLEIDPVPQKEAETPMVENDLKIENERDEND